MNNAVNHTGWEQCSGKMKTGMPLKGRKVLSLLLCILMTGSLLTVPVTVSHAAKKPRLSHKKVVLQQKKSKKIRLKNANKKVKWTVSGKKLVTLKVSGKKRQTVTIRAGRKTGTCYVTARCGRKKYRCRVTVKKKSSAKKKQENAFREKALSSSSKDMTASCQARKVTVKEPDETFAEAMAQTGIRLLQEAAASGKGGENILLSPDSILTALTMAEKGAAGETLSEMEKALGGIPVQTSSQYLAGLHGRIAENKGVTYDIANSIWYRKGQIKVKSSFLQNCVSGFDAQVFAAPFDGRTVTDMNSWVYNHTRGKIPSIISRLEADMKLALLNAIYFKGAWAEPFADPVKGSFTNAQGRQEEAQMLQSTEHSFVSVKGAKGFVKPYAGGKTAFLALLPPKGKTAAGFLRELTGRDLITAFQKRETDHILVRTKLPQFSYDCEISLKEPLQAMGMRQAFADHADFSNMAKERVKIDQILHKTHISLDKNGTEAAAVTAILMKTASAMFPEEYTIKEVYLDRPFVYALIDMETGIPLFVGIVNSIS